MHLARILPRPQQLQRYLAERRILVHRVQIIQPPTQHPRSPGRHPLPLHHHKISRLPLTRLQHRRLILIPYLTPALLALIPRLRQHPLQVILSTLPPAMLQPQRRRRLSRLRNIQHLPRPAVHTRHPVHIPAPLLVRPRYLPILRCRRTPRYQHTPRHLLTPLLQQIQHRRLPRKLRILIHLIRIHSRRRLTRHLPRRARTEQPQTHPRKTELQHILIILRLRIQPRRRHTILQHRPQPLLRKLPRLRLAIDHKQHITRPLRHLLRYVPLAVQRKRTLRTLLHHQLPPPPRIELRKQLPHRHRSIPPIRPRRINRLLHPQPHIALHPLRQLQHLPRRQRPRQHPHHKIPRPTHRLPAPPAPPSSARHLQLQRHRKPTFAQPLQRSCETL